MTKVYRHQALFHILKMRELYVAQKCRVCGQGQARACPRVQAPEKRLQTRPAQNPCVPRSEYGATIVFVAADLSVGFDTCVLYGQHVVTSDICALHLGVPIFHRRLMPDSARSASPCSIGR